MSGNDDNYNDLIKNALKEHGDRLKNTRKDIHGKLLKNELTDKIYKEYDSKHKELMKIFNKTDKSLEDEKTIETLHQELSILLGKMREIHPVVELHEHPC